MRSINSHYFRPDQLWVWRGPNDKWMGDGTFRDLKVELFDIGWYYEQQHCEFSVEADDRCVYIKTVKADPDTIFNRTIGVRVSWDNGKLYFPVPSIGWEDPNNAAHRINSHAIQEYFDEDDIDFKNDDGTYNIDAIVERMWIYYKGKESFDDGQSWEWISTEDFRKKLCDNWKDIPQLIKNYVERKLNNDRG